MIWTASNRRTIMLRDFSSAFMRTSFTNVLKYNDYTFYDWLISEYPIKVTTYFEFLKYIYSVLSRNYRCEYIYKNELIKSLLAKYGSSSTVFFNEFRVGNSIADIVMFNGESKAFEIKTELDSPKRLNKQMSDYSRLFDRCYIVIPENNYGLYNSSIELNTGIIVMRKANNGRFYFEEAREAQQNTGLDVDVLMSCLRTDEYKGISRDLGVHVDEVPGYDLFTVCTKAMKEADIQFLKDYFLKTIKRRQNNTKLLKSYPTQLRQMMLCLNLSKRKADKLLEKLEKAI